MKDAFARYEARGQLNFALLKDSRIKKIALVLRRSVHIYCVHRALASHRITHWFGICSFRDIPLYRWDGLFLDNSIFHARVQSIVLKNFTISLCLFTYDSLIGTQVRFRKSTPLVGEELGAVPVGLPRRGLIGRHARGVRL